MAVQQAVLIMIQGAEPGSIHKLPDNRVTSVGRSSRNAVRAVCPGVSRFHCEVYFVNGHWELRDLNSKRGTLVNGEPVVGRHILEPGDIIRLSSTAFRFDMVDESLREDDAMLAILEAEMDRRLLRRGEGVGSLDGIRARSRLEGDQTRQDREARARVLKRNLAFLAAVAGATAVLAGTALAYAHRSAAAAPAPSARQERQGRELYGEALARARSGDRLGALNALWTIRRDLPGTSAAQDAATLRADLLWAEAQNTLAFVGKREAEENYAAALQLYDDLEALHPDELLLQLLREGRRQTVALAQAAFAVWEQNAERAVQNGDAASAIETYRRAAASVGVPELVARAQARIGDLEQAPPP